MNHILICKDEMIKQLKENIRTYFCDFGMGKNFLNGTKTALTIKENIDKLTTSKLETSTFKKSLFAWFYSLSVSNGIKKSAYSGR